MSDVFISYSRRDKAFVQRLHHALAAEGRDTWVDWEDIEYTEDWWAGIQAGIEKADTFIFVISPDSVASEVCHEEINHAAAHNKRLVPIVYRDAPTDQVPEKLKHLNWLFFREDDDFDRVFQDLMRVMDTDLEWVKAHTRLTVRAVEWESYDRNDSFVLRGDDLKEAEQRLDQRDKEPQLTELQVQYIVASQRSAIRRQRLTLGGVAVGLIVAAVLAVIAFLMFQASQREAAQRALAEDRAQSEADARATAVSIQTTAEAEADVAATRAGEAQAAAYVAETAEAEALGAQATAVAARQTADAGREAAVVAEQTAQAARATAQAQQAQAEQGRAEAIAAQQTAQAAEQAAVQAQQTAQAGQATAEASQATAEAQQAEAEAAARQAEVAAQQARQAQAEAEAAAQQAQQAQAEAEAAQAAAEATLVAVEALRDEAEQRLREVQRATFIAKYAENCEIGAGNPVALASDGASVWVAKENELLRLSAYDCQNLGSLSVAASDITYGGGYVWAVSGNQVHQISLASTRIINTFQAGSAESQATAVLYDGSSIWVASSSGGQNIIHKIDPASGATSSYDVGDGLPVELAYGGGYIWFRRGGGVVSRISAIDGTSSDDISFGYPVPSVTSGGGYIWVVSCGCAGIECHNSIAKLNASSGAVESVFDYTLRLRGFSSLVFDGNNIWVSEDDRITEIRADNGRMGTEVPTDGRGSTAMIFDGTYMWVLFSEYVTRIPISIEKVGMWPTALAEDGTYIWVANSADFTLGKHLASTGEQVQLLEIEPYAVYKSMTCVHPNIWLQASWLGISYLYKLSSEDGRILCDGAGEMFGDIAYDNNRYIWVGTVREGVMRLRESDCEPAGTFLDGMNIPGLLYDGSYIWVIGYSERSPLPGDDSLIKLDPIDGSRLATYPLGLLARHLVYDENNHSFWVLGSGDGGDTLILQVSAEDGTIITPAIPIPGDYILSLAYGGTHVWVSRYSDNTVIRIDSSNPANQVNYAVCDEPDALLYTRAGKGVWVACQAEGLIQKLSANPDLSGLSTLEPASLPSVTLGDDARRVYLPVMMKEAAPALAGAEPGQTPGVTGPPPSVAPTATATMTPISILIPTPTAVSP
jgi:DNA-binding beta-propeller fold protein YncE